MYMYANLEVFDHPHMYTYSNLEVLDLIIYICEVRTYRLVLDHLSNTILLYFKMFFFFGKRDIDTK